MRESVAHRERLGEWWTLGTVLMPDHVHMLVAKGRGHSLTRVVTSWKRYTARQLSIRWQRGFFEHRLRGAASLEQKVEYLRLNPVRAGLVARPEDWPYTWHR